MSTNDFQPDPYVPPYLQDLERARFEASKLSRRNFIKITGLAGGGLVLAMGLGPTAQKALAQAKPGATTLAVMLRGASSLASDRARPTRPALDAA